MIKYHQVKEAANQLLIYQKKLDTKFDVREMKFKDHNIIFDSLQNYAEISGLPLNILLHDKNSPIRDGLRIYLPDQNLHLILYNDDICCQERLRFTLAHEIGHVILCHDKDCDIAELEADCFAAQLLSPWFTIKMLGNVAKPTALQLSSIFQISVSAANRRISDVHRSFYKLTDTDKMVYDMQKEQVHRIYSETYRQVRREAVYV